MAKFDPEKMKKDKETSEKAAKHLKEKREKQFFRKVREKLISKSSGRTLATQEKQIKGLKLE